MVKFICKNELWGAFCQFQGHISNILLYGAICDTTFYVKTVISFIGLILGLRPANERPRYFVTKSFIGLVQA